MTPSQSGRAVTFTARVTGADGTPVGDVSFRDGASVLGTVTLAEGVATFTTATLATGSHSINALYGGYGAYGSSGSAVLLQIVGSSGGAIVSGDGTICAGSSLTIQAALSGAPPWSITWSDGVTQSGITTTPATRNVSPPATMTYTVTAVSDANGPGSSSGSAIVTVNQLPLQPAAFTASLGVVCPGQSGVAYAVPADPTVSYSWAYSGIGATINGAGSEITIDFSGTATSGTLAVTATNGCGTSAARTLEISVESTFYVDIASGLDEVGRGAR
ncbi:hypothetical protein EG835_03200, partial [bacterium]|nr:hypothetical protein [bacterium]